MRGGCLCMVFLTTPHIIPKLSHPTDDTNVLLMFLFFKKLDLPVCLSSSPLLQFYAKLLTFLCSHHNPYKQSNPCMKTTATPSTYRINGNRAYNACCNANTYTTSSGGHHDMDCIELCHCSWINVRIYAAILNWPRAATLDHSRF